MPRLPVSLLALGFAGLCATAQIALAQIQVADFRLTRTEFEAAHHPFQPGFGPFPTRDVHSGAFASAKVDFSGITQNPRFGTDEDDITLRTYHGATVVGQISRFAAAPNSSVQRIGAVQWEIDLTEFEASLAARGSKVQKLELRLVLEGSKDIKIDTYLLPGRAGDKLPPLHLLSLSPEDCFRFLWMPSQFRAVGDVVRIVPEGERSPDASRSDTLRVAASGFEPNGSVIVDITADYLAGRRQFALVLTSASYGKNRSVRISEGSGVFVITEKR